MGKMKTSLKILVRKGLYFIFFGPLKARFLCSNNLARFLSDRLLANEMKSMANTFSLFDAEPTGHFL